MKESNHHLRMVHMSYIDRIVSEAETIDEQVACSRAGIADDDSGDVDGQEDGSNVGSNWTDDTEDVDVP